MPAPTRTPATSSVDNRKPRAIADGSAVGPDLARCRRDGMVIAEPFAETAATARRAQPRRLGVGRDHHCRARRRPCFRHPQSILARSRHRRRPKAARTILTRFGQVKNSTPRQLSCRKPYEYQMVDPSHPERAQRPSRNIPIQSGSRRPKYRRGSVPASKW